MPALADMAVGHGCQFVYARFGTVAFIGGTRFPFAPAPSETIAVRVLVRPPGHVDRRTWARAVRETKRTVAAVLRDAAAGVQPIVHGTRHGAIRILING